MEPPQLALSYAQFPDHKFGPAAPGSHGTDTSSSQASDDCAILPRRTKVLVIGNNRTKRSLVGQEGEVKKAVGLGGWHYIVLGNGEEVKLQRNALSVLELAAEDGQDSSSDELTETREPQIEILTRPRIRRPPKALSPVPDVNFKRQAGIGGVFGSSFRPSSSAHTCWTLVNPQKLETLSLRRYRRVFQLPVPADQAAGRDELLQAVHQHLAAQLLEEQQVLGDFVAAVKRRYRQQQLLIQQYPSHYGHLQHSHQQHHQQQQHQQLHSTSLHQPSSFHYY